MLSERTQELKPKGKKSGKRILMLTAQIGTARPPTPEWAAEDDHVLIEDVSDPEREPERGYGTVNEKYSRNRWEQWTYQQDSHEVRKNRNRNLRQCDGISFTNHGRREWTDRRRNEEIRMMEKGGQEESDGNQREEDREAQPEERVRAQGQLGQNNIKERRIGLTEFTNPSLYDRYWISGKLRPGTSLYIDSAPQSMNPTAQPFHPRDTNPSTLSECPRIVPATAKKVFPPYGLILPWNGVVLVGTSAVALTKKEIQPGRQQIVVTIAGTTAVVADPNTSKTETFKGRATIILDEVQSDAADAVPRPSGEALAAMWTAIFDPHNATSARVIARVPPNPKGEGIPPRERNGIDQVVSTRKVKDGRIKKNSPKVRKQKSEFTLMNHIVQGGIPKEYPDDKSHFHEDAIPAIIEAALINASPGKPRCTSPAVSKPKTSQFRGEVEEDSEAEMDDLDEWVSRLERELREEEGRNSPTSQGIESSAESSISDDDHFSFTEYEIPVSPSNPEPDAPKPPMTDSPMIDDFKKLGKEGAVGMEGEEVLTKDDHPKKAMFFIAGEEPEDAWPAMTGDKALDIELVPLLPMSGTLNFDNYAPHTPDSLPSLLEASATTASSESIEEREATLARLIDEGNPTERPAWTTLASVLARDLERMETRLETKIRRVDEMLNSYFPDPYSNPAALPPWTAPYATWEAHTVTEGKLATLQTFSEMKAKELEALQGECEGYQGAMEEQLNRRFVGLKNSLNTRIESVEGWVGRIDNRQRETDQQKMTDREKCDQTQQIVNQVQNDFARTIRDSHGSIVGLIGTNTELLERQVNLICDIIGIARLAPATKNILEPAKAGSIATKDPRKAAKAIDRDQYEGNQPLFNPEQFYGIAL